MQRHKQVLVDLESGCNIATPNMLIAGWTTGAIRHELAKTSAQLRSGVAAAAFQGQA